MLRETEGVHQGGMQKKEHLQSYGKTAVSNLFSCPDIWCLGAGPTELQHRKSKLIICLELPSGDHAYGVFPIWQVP